MSGVREGLRPSDGGWRRRPASLSLWRARGRGAATRTHDELTGLPGRDWVVDLLANALKVGGPADSWVAVLLIDLEGLSGINESFGHDTGDQILVATASRLNESLRNEDVVARFGGQEFLVVVRGEQPERQARELAARLGDLLADPVATDRHLHPIRVSIGVAAAEGGGIAADTLVRRAAVAMHQAKQSRTNRVVSFEAWMHDDAQRRVELGIELRGVLESGELQLLYQPVVDLERAAVVGAEALVRWQHPTRGLLGPSEFIPLAESNGQIRDIGRWILAEACRHAVEWGWAAAGPGGPFMSVNVSAPQMTDPAFPAEVDAVLRETGVEPTCLVLEITESTVLEDTSAVLERVNEFKQLGVRIALDDYGTGYSSMSRLLAFPVDVLKIDRIFVAPASRGDATARALVRSAVSLCEELGMTAIAEGIETAREARQMRACGCRYGQGYLLGRPVPAEVFGVLRHARQIDERPDSLAKLTSTKRRRTDSEPRSGDHFPADAT